MFGPIMRAAVIREVGSPPEVGDAEEPSGETIEVLAAPINPIDLAVSRGILATGHPPLPYVPGCEAVGRGGDGRLVWLFGGSLGRTSNGAMAERAAIGDSHVYDVPDGADPALAAGLGIAGLAGWLPLAWRAPLEGGENVLVLGATGSVGLVAVQVAKLLGAARVVAAGRSAAGLERAAQARGRRDDPSRRSGRSRRGLQGCVRRRGPELRLRPALGRARRRCGPGSSSVGENRQPRPVRRTDVGARVRGRAFQEPDDLRTYGLCSRAGRTCGALPTPGRARDGGRHRPRGRAHPARLRRGRVAPSGRGRRREARRRALEHRRPFLGISVAALRRRSEAAAPLSA